jgi:serine/threonine protein kinase
MPPQHPLKPSLEQGEEATVASDVYAFGITLFEIFTREEPFKGQEFRDVLTKLIDNTAPEEDARPKLPDDMPKNISNTIRKCWAQLPSWRPTFRELLSWISEIGLEDTNDARADQPFGRNRLITSKRDSDSLAQDLYERFPRAMANAILAGRKPKPEKFECASIFSAQIEGFSEISQILSADQITDLFHRLFSHFDELSSDFGVFKVDTIGVSYVAVTNLVEEQPADHAER